MQALTTYRASDRRVYYGAPCSDMQREWDHTAALQKRLNQTDPTAKATYFPAEGKYLVSTWQGWEEHHTPPKAITGNMHEDKQEALIEAIKVLEEWIDAAGKVPAPEHLRG